LLVEPVAWQIRTFVGRATLAESVDDTAATPTAVAASRITAARRERGALRRRPVVTADRP
jgi:hypothetical protein